MKAILVCCMLLVAARCVGQEATGNLCVQQPPVLVEEKPALTKVLDTTCDVPFGTFCAFIDVPKEQLTDFATYYETQTKKIKRVKSNGTRQARAQQLRDKGRSALEVEEPGLYAEFKAFEDGILPCMSPRACVAQNARLFLSRYGAWHEFKKSYVQSQASMWAKVKGFAKESKQKVAQLFGAPQEVTLAAN